MTKKIKNMKSIICMIIYGIVFFSIGYLCNKPEIISTLNQIITNNNGIISLINVVISATGIISILLLFFQIKAEHEKGRREKSVELLLEWSKGLKKEANESKKIVEKFTYEQCKDLFDGEEIRMNCIEYNTIVNLFSENSKEKIDKKVKNEEDKSRCELEERSDSEKRKCNKECTTLEKRYVNKLRWQIISYLNFLESILVSWQYSVVDKEIIEKQFEFLLDPKEDKKILDKFRKVSGEEAYPAIKIFCNELEKKRKEALTKKGNVDKIK